ncbi:MAG: hypothetical protein R6U68_10480, partial [Desulfobacteraceae bacterium]
LFCIQNNSLKITGWRLGITKYQVANSLPKTINWGRINGVGINKTSGAPIMEFDGITWPRGCEFDTGVYEYIVTGNQLGDIRINGTADSLVGDIR